MKAVIVYKENEGLRVVAYPGDNKILIAMSLREVRKSCREKDDREKKTAKPATNKTAKPSKKKPAAKRKPVGKTA